MNTAPKASLTPTAQQKSGEQSADAAQQQSPKKKAQQRFSRLTTFSLVLLAILAVAGVAHYVFGIELLNGQLGVLALLGAIAVFLIGQFIRFRERISLRTLLIIVTVLAIGMAYFGRNLADSRNETNVVEQLVEAGAVATYGKLRQPSGEYFRTEDGYYLPIWIRDWMGAGFFSNLRELDLSRAGMKDEHLAMLADIRSLESLDLCNSNLSAAGVAQLPLIPGLQRLHLTWDQIAPESMEHIGRVRDLKSVWVRPPNNAFGAPNGPLPPSEPIAALGQLKQVEDMQLNIPAIEPQGMAAIAKLPSLRRLSLFGYPTSAAIDVSGFAELGQSQTIHEISVNLVEFTDAELEHLQSINSLQMLNLFNTGVTAAGARAFQEARPDVTLYLNPPLPELQNN